MKIKFTSAFIVLLFITCAKENTSRLPATDQSKIGAAGDISIPINDLGKGTYNGYIGGLFPGGVNKPSGQYATDLLAISKTIVPIDTFGKSSSKGKIVFMSVGGSTGGHNMKLLIEKTIGNPATNPNLKLFSCNNGSGEGSLNSLMNAKSPYWNHVTQVIKGTKSSYRQIQVIYLETEDSTRLFTWPGRATIVKKNLEACMRVFKKKFPNIKVVYVLGRSKTFGAKALWNQEPSPYYFGWACKWAIEDQINGVPGTKYKGADAVAPMITWGFYQWADSLPRKTDGFSWVSTQTADGLHATYEGQDTLATRFQNFLLTDKYAKIWYAK